MTILSFDRQVWPWLSTYLNISFKWTTTPQGELQCQVVLKFILKCSSYVPDKLSLWPFYHLTFKCDLDLQLTWKNVSNGTTSPLGVQLCHIILNSMHKYRSYGPDKLNLWLLQVWPWPSAYLEKCVKWLFSSSMSTTAPNYFEIQA